MPRDWEGIDRDVAQAITLDGIDLGYTADEMPGISVWWQFGVVEERVGEHGITNLVPRYAGLTARAMIALAQTDSDTLKAAFGPLASGAEVDFNIFTIPSGTKPELKVFTFVGLHRTLTAERCWARIADQATRRALFEQNIIPIQLTFYPDDNGSLCRWSSGGGGSNGGEGVPL